MDQNEQKALVGRAALQFVPDGAILGVGTGSTVDCFIDALSTIKGRIAGAVSSSVRSTERLRAHGITVFEAHDVASLPVYIDGADEIDHRGCMIKGGGAALTREKIVADLAARFICIADASKLVDTLGRYPLPIEVIAMGSTQVMRRVERLGGRPSLRAGVLTDNGHPVIDVHGLRIGDPLAMETEMNQWPGVVTVGIFARHRAQVCLLGTPHGVRTLHFEV